MLVGREKIDESVDAIIRALEADSESDLAEVDDIMIVAVVHYGTTHDGNGDFGSLFYRCSSGRKHIQLGMLEQARQAVNQNTRSRDED